MSDRSLDSDADDEALAKGLADRDPRALAAIYERYGSITFGFLLKTLRDRPTAEDVLQQVYLEVWQRAPTFDDRRGELVAWILTIARSRAIDQLRRRVPEPVGVIDEELGPDTVSAQVEDTAERWRVAALLDRLPREESMVIRLRFYGELSQREIAERTGLPLGTVKTRMVSGLRRLRELLEGP